MDVGCGDGLLLKKIYLHLNKILDRKSLKKITLIGIDLNQISINAAKKNNFVVVYKCYNKVKIKSYKYVRYY